MEKIAWVTTLVELAFYNPVIKCFEDNIVDLYIGRIHDLRLPEALQDWPVNFHYKEITQDALQKYENIVVSRNFLWGGLKDFNLETTRCIALTHAVDAPLSSGSMAARWYIAASRRQAETPESGKVICSHQPELAGKLLSLPVLLRNEYAYSGPYHLGEWAVKRHCPKEELQQELEEFLGCSFDRSKPVVAFLQDEFCHEQQLIDGLGRLAEHVNLVIKAGPRISALPGVFAHPHKSFAPNLLRFAADYILAGYHSGTLASATMLGLQVIPYYSSMVFRGGRAKGKRARYTVYLERQRNGDNIGVDILESLNSPVNIQDTENILARISDEDWWAQYRKRLPAAQKTVFGDYDIDHAAEKTAQLIRRVFEKETFGENTAAVRLRPEYGHIVRKART